MRNHYFKAILYTAGITIVAAGCFFSGTKRDAIQAVPAELQSIIHDAWQHVGSTKSACDTFDYFPDGGMRNFYCHLLNYITYKRFVELIGIPVFVKGPHTGLELDLNSHKSFGYYNKEFVKRISGILIPGANDSAFKSATQPVYDACMKKLCRIFFVTYRKLKENQGYSDKEQKEYLRRMNAGTLDYEYHEKFFFFMNPNFMSPDRERSDMFNNGFDGGWEGNVVKTCVGFWLRRSIDGTAEEFYCGLEKLLQSYDNAFYTSGGKKQ